MSLQQLHADISEALSEAAGHDAEARELRRLAGRLLVRARGEARIGEPWLPQGMDQASAKHLIRLAAGGRERP